MVLDALLAADSFEIVGLLDDDEGKIGQKLLGVPVLGRSVNLRERAGEWDFEGVAVAIGDNYVREKKFCEVRQAGLVPVSVVHPTACISRFVELGEGVTILAGCVLNPGTVIEDNVCVNTSASVDHDNYLERSCHVFPNATLTGGVRVKGFAYVGSGAVVNPYLTVNRYAYVGAGAVVVEDVAEGVTVAGVPAREIGRQSKRPEQLEAKGS